MLGKYKTIFQIKKFIFIFLFKFFIVGLQGKLKSTLNMSKLTKEIYKAIKEHCGGHDKILGSNATTLILMSKGKTNPNVSTVKKLLEANGMTGEIVIKGKNTVTNINLFD